jgi:hypothetical protein
MAHGYELVPSGPGRWAIDLGNDADTAAPLEMAPDKLEPELTAGKWLILAFAVWSGPDHAAIRSAVEVGREERIRVGIRPFDEFSEFAAWCPDVHTGTRSPVWLLLQDGQVVRSAAGLLSKERVSSLLRS